MVIDYQQ